MDVVDRFFSKVEKTSHCWYWVGGKDSGGYGLIRIDRSKIDRVHRLSWEYHNNACIRSGVCVLHKCDNPACVNPEHLFLGTLADNNHDRHSKGRTRWRALKGENHGSAKLTLDNVTKIRQLARDGHSHEEIAEIFQISDKHCYHIIRGYYWKD